MHQAPKSAHGPTRVALILDVFKQVIITDAGSYWVAPALIGIWSNLEINQGMASFVTQHRILKLLSKSVFFFKIKKKRKITILFVNF